MLSEQNDIDSSELRFFLRDVNSQHEGVFVEQSGTANPIETFLPSGTLRELCADPADCEAAAFHQTPDPAYPAFVDMGGDEGERRGRIGQGSRQEQR